MYIKKIVGSTVDKLTLSYIEKHLKEALDQEYAIPTTVLSTIAEKSFNEYNMKSISHFLEKSFKIDYKDWKKFRNLLKIIEYLLKFGSNEFVLLAKQHQSDIRSLQNYSFSEGGTDKGAGIRESALLILTMLNNSRELELMREESKRHREKFTGISSNPSENNANTGFGGGYSAPVGYNGSGGYGGNGGGYSSSSYSGSNYVEPRGNRKNEGFLYSESQKKFAESVFGGKIEGTYQGPEAYGQPFGSKKNEREEFKYESTNKSTYSAPDIFAVGGGSRTEKSGFVAPDLFSTQKSEQRKDIFGDNNIVRNEQRGNTKVPDLFEKDKKLYGSPDLFAPNNFSSAPISPPHSSLSSVNLLSSDSANPIQKQVPDLFSNMKLSSSSKAPDLFTSINTAPAYISYPETKPDIKPQIAAHTDLFSLSHPAETPDLFSINPSKPSIPEKIPNKPVDLFANVNRKDLKPSKSPEFNSDIFGMSINEPKIQPDLNINSKNTPANPELFGFNETSSYNPQNIGNLLADIKISATQSSQPSSIFTGMVQKRPSEPTLTPNVSTTLTGTGLEGLSFEISPNPNLNPGSMKSNQNFKVKTNLIQTEEKTKTDQAKKVFNPSEFEAKLFSLDFK